jgi:hypothetical protein
MNLKEIMNADMRVKQNKDELQQWLLRIPQLKNRTPDGENVNIDNIEILLYKLCQKYGIHMQWITPSKLKDEILWYSFSFKKVPEQTWFHTAYGHTIYEAYAKATLYLYATLERVNK